MSNRDKAEAAYARSDLFEKRRKLMEDSGRAIWHRDAARCRAVVREAMDIQERSEQVCAFLDSPSFRWQRFPEAAG